jgi:hypothetical protein
MLRVIKAFQDSIDRHLPKFVILDRLRAVTVPKLSSFYRDKLSLNPINNVTTTDNQITIINDTQI